MTAAGVPLPRPAYRFIATLGALLMVVGPPLSAKVQPARAPAEEVVRILDRAVFHWEESKPEVTDGETFTVRFAGQSVDASVMLPPHPLDPAQMRRLTLEVHVEPIPASGEPHAGRPADPWPRLGSVLLVRENPSDASAPTFAGASTARRRGPEEIELMRFVTGFGSRGSFTQDVTALAPLLTGPVTIRTVITTYSDDPGWRATVRLRLSPIDLGAARPRFAAPLLTDFHVTAEEPRRRMDVTVPSGMQIPRLRILSTGHATDGAAGNEFQSASHVLRIGGREVARWRPWREGDGTLRPLNRWSGRRTTDGRTVWSSDLGRSGWAPGTVVEAFWIPLPELTPGRHRLELSIEDIRPADPPDADGQAHHGYWAVSAILVADEVWIDP